MDKKIGIPLLVTTLHRGVFFGYGQPTDAETIQLRRVRMCVYWSTDMRGVMGLASKGPSKTCKIGPEVPAVTLRNVTGVVECTAAAAKAWEDGPWAT